MNEKFTQNLLKFIFALFLGFLINPLNLIAQNCDVPTGMNETNVSNFSATLNWNFDGNVDHYRLRYKEVGTSSWSYEHNATGISNDISALNSSSTYIWQAKAFCSTGNSPSSDWSAVDTFITTNYPVDCNNTPNGIAFTDSCGNCVGGTTGAVACIDFTPSVSITLSSTECDIPVDITFITGQDANEPDISSTVFTSDAGQFDFIGLSTNDIIGSSAIVAGGGYININTTLMVDFIISANKITVKAVDNVTGQVYGSFTIENDNGGILVVATSLPDNNNVTSGNSQTILLNGLFVNPNPTTITFTSTINSELGDIDYQNSTETIECVDCNGDLGGIAFTDSCGNCVGGNTGDAACIPFTPTVTVSLSNTNCDSLSDLTISVSQDPNEPDMSTSLFASNSGYFDISNMNLSDTIGSAVMSASGGNINFSTNLVVTSIISSNQVIIQSQDINTGLVLGTFTITNLNPGVSITANSVPDNNNVTSGNSQTVTFTNVFVNPGAGVLTFTSTINSEIGDQDVQNFPFAIACLCVPNGYTDVVTACNSYTWIDGVTYTTSNNTASQTLTNAGGCDSVVTLNLTINGSTTSSVSVTECDSYDWNGTTYTSSGVYTFASTNANGCDSTATLNLTINGSTTSSVSVTECDSYDWNGTTYTSSGVYTFASTNANGCDSTATLNLTINGSTTSSVSVTECDSYDWNGTTYTSSGVYTFASTNANGCDSTATLNLTINGSTTSSVSVTECDSYDWNGTTYTSSGVYTFASTNANGCDSTATLNLTINGSTTSSVSVTECDSYDWNGTTYTSSGVYTFASTNANGCDSTATLNLTINGSTTSSVSVTECDSYDWNGTTYTSSGVYTFASTNANGCDSTATLNLTINGSTTSSVSVTECDSYDWNGTTYTSSGVYTFASTNANGCDSTATLNLTINGSTTSSVSVTECDSYDWNGTTYTSSGVYTFASTNANGCDSTATLNLTINGSTTSSVSVTECDSYDWNGTTYTSSGVYTFASTNANGCDSTATLNLTINGSTTSSVSVTECDSYDWNGTTYTSSGVYTFASTNANGCDSTATLNLTINGSTTSSVSVTECDSYDWNGTTYTSSGVYTFASTNANGCDSTATLNLTINGSTTSSVSVTECDSYDWNGTTYTSSGVYTFASTNANGCDSTATLNLTINGSTTSSVSVTECDSYDWNGTTYTSSGVYTFASTNANGCDSTATLNLTINGSTTSSVSVTECDSYDWNGTTYTSSGVYTFASTNANGCDSTATLNLTINGSTTSSVSVTECDSYDWNGTTYTSSGVYTFASTNANGCDSTATLNLTINGSTTSSVSVTECDSYDWNGTTYTSSGVYTFASTNANGCDSTATLNLTINNSNTSTTNVTIPNTYTWNGVAYTSSGVYTYSTLNADGCDSTATLNLTILTCDVPLTPVTHTILLDRATMTWDAVAGADHYEIRFKQVGTPTWQYLNNYSTSRTKTNLSSATSYHWQVRTHCDASAFNISEWTDTIVFQTMIPCATPTNPSDSVVGLDFATVTWDNDPNALAFRVRYWKTGAFIIDTTYTNSITLSGLDNSSTYNWQVKALCDANNINSSVWTPTQQFVTLTPCINPSVLLVDSVGVNEAYLSWTAPSGTDHFVVLYSELGSGVWNSTTTANTNIILTGLATYAPYEWSLLAFCEASGLNNSDTISGNNFVTANPCTPPTTGMFSSNVLLDRFTMNWDAVALADHYEIRFKEQGSAIWQMLTNITNTYKTKNNLTAGTTYEWEVRSICDASGTSFSDWSATQTQATLTPCVTPLNPVSANVTLSTADLSWDNDPSVWAYRVRYWETGAFIIDTTYTNSITLSGLDNSSTYNWQVKAICDANGNNSSSWTSNQTFNTITACTTPFNLAANQITLNSVKFVMYGPNSPDHYYVLYREVGATSWDTATISAADISGTYASQVVTGLNSATTYEWKSQASCQADDSNLSAFATGNNFTTVTPCNTPSNLASLVSGEDVTFSWDAVTGSVFYTLKYKQIGGSTGWQTISNFTNPTYTVNNLGYGVSYQWVVSSSCDQSGTNISAFSSPDTVSTATCPAPQNIGVSNIQTDQVKIYWDNNPDVHHFAARARVAGTTIWTKNIQTIYGSNRTITGLNDGTIYEFQVRSACFNDTSSVSAWSALQTFTTLANCNAKPSALTTSNITLSSADLSFTGTPNAVAYLVRFKTIAGAFNTYVYDTLLSPTVSISKTSLISGTGYEWQVRAMCDLAGANISGWANQAIFYTLSPCQDATNLTVVTNQTTTSTLKLRWSQVWGTYGYKLAFKDSASTTWDTLLIVSNSVTNITSLPFGVAGTVTSNSGNIDVVLSGLTAGTTYNWQVMTVCESNGINNSSYVNGPNTTTLPPCTTPGGLSATAIGADNATVNWGATATADHYALRARVAGTSTWSINPAYIYGTSKTMYGLTDGTVYEWQVRTVCSTDTSEVSAWSALQTFTTLANCNAKPSALTTSNITLSSADLSFTGTPNAVAYLVRFKTIAGAFNTYVYDTLLSPTVSISKTSLISGTGYEWQVRAMCDLAGANISGWANQAIFYTLSPCQDATNLTVVTNQTTTSTLKLRWSQVWGTYGYKLAFKDSASTTWDTLLIVSNSVTNITSLPFGVAGTVTSNSGNIDVVLSGLTAGTTYNWQVMTVCESNGINNSSYVNGPNTTTLPPCTTPGGLSATAIGADNATVNWGATATADHYALRARVAGTSTWSINPAYIYGTSKTMYGLTDGTVYEWQVRTVCSTDTSEVSAWSALQTFTTLVSCNNIPNNPTENSINMTSAVLTWDALNSAQAYEIRFRKLSDPWSSNVHTIITSTSITKTGLISGTDYTWDLRAICDTVNGVQSSWTGFRTFTTADPCADPTNLGVRGNYTTLTEASVKFFGPNNTDFLVIFKETTASNWDTVIVNNAVVTNVTALPFGVAVTSSQVGQEQRVFFTGLSSATEYEWMVVTACSPSNLSSAVTGPNFTTLTGCQVPTGLLATPLTNNATISWSAVTGATFYEVRKRLQGTSNWSGIGTSYGLNKTFWNLTPGDSYEWQVRSQCDYTGTNISPWSSIESFTTQNVCTKPTNADEINITTTTADLVWDAIPGAWGYRLIYLENGAAWNTKVVDTINTNLDAIALLNPGTTYKWRVKGICDASGQNNSPWTGWQFFSTLSSNRITAGDVRLGANLNVYPNPTDGVFNISFISEEIDNFEITIIDAFGKLVSKEEKQNFVGEYAKQVDVSGYSRGIYMVQIKTENSFVSKRIVLQ